MAIRLLKKIKKDHFYKDLLVTFSGQIVVMGLTFVLNKIISNQYSVSDYGLYNLIKRFIAVISYIMLMAMGIAIPKYISEAKAQKNKKLMESYMICGLLLIISMFLILFFILLLGKSVFSRLIFADASASKYIFSGCLFAFGSCLVTYAYSFYRGTNDFIRYNMVNIAMQIIMILVTLIITDNLYELYSLWGWLLLAYGVFEIVIIYKNNHFRIQNIKKKVKPVWKSMIAYALPRIPGEFALFAYNLIPLIIITYKFGNMQVGYFSAALSINSLVTPMFGLVGTILLPLVSSSRIMHKEEDINRKIKELAYIYIVVSLLVIILIYLFGGELLSLLLNSEYKKCIHIVRITSLSILPNAFYLLLRNPLDGKSDFPYNTVCLLIGLLAYIVALLFAPSIEMCAVATIISYSMLGIFSLLAWKKVSKSL